MTSDDRAVRLEGRFRTLQQTIEELTDRDTAYAVAAAAWLQGIEYATLQAFRRLDNEVGAGLQSKEHAEALISKLHLEIKTLLMSFHRELCLHLGRDQDAIIQRCASFREVIDDICKQRG